jgi:tRNA threonylcarbamoyladenosine biosynthesis protein TsaB
MDARGQARTMNILALEFSSTQRSVALVQRQEHGLAMAEVTERGAPAMRPLAMIEEALRQAQLEREQIAGIAVGLGPGSYTGIRAAIALAQGWELALGVKLLGISSADAVAAEAQAEGVRGPAGVVIDAQRGEFYLGLYELTERTFRSVEPLRLAARAEVQAALAAGKTLVGPELTQWFAEGRRVFPRGAVLGHLAMGRTDFVPGEKLEPIYLRPVQFVQAPPPRILTGGA